MGGVTMKPLRTHCIHGHELTPDNVWVGEQVRRTKDGREYRSEGRHCKTCISNRKRFVITAIPPFVPVPTPTVIGGDVVIQKDVPGPRSRRRSHHELFCLDTRSPWSGASVTSPQPARVHRLEGDGEQGNRHRQTEGA